MIERNKEAQLNEPRNVSLAMLVQLAQIDFRPNVLTSPNGLSSEKSSAAR